LLKIIGNEGFYNVTRGSGGGKVIIGNTIENEELLSYRGGDKKNSQTLTQYL